jgi:very-short-patch-repair endonuclease
VIAVLVIPNLKKRQGLSDASFPYRKKDYLLSKAEKSFYHVLQNCLNDSYVIFPKVRLSDIFFVTCKEKYQSYFNKISSKHIDFLICNKQNLTPLAAIELDDSSHANKKEGDNFKDNLFLSAGLPLYRIKASYNYNPAQIKETLKTTLNDLI